MIGRFKRWFSARFIFISEVVGFLLCGLVFVGVAYSLFVKAEVIVTTTGTLQPVATVIQLDTEAVLVGYVAAAGDKVEADQAVCRIVTEEDAKKQVLARRNLEETLRILAPNGADAAENETVATIRELLREIPVPTNVEVLTAQSAGRLECEQDPDADHTLPAGASLATIFDLSALELTAVIVGEDAEKVAVGQLVRVIHPEASEPLEGRVESVEAAEETATALLRFDAIPGAVRESYLTALESGQAVSVSAASVELVIGHRSLFRQIFGRQ